jgi:hypothetical protein
MTTNPNQTSGNTPTPTHVPTPTEIENRLNQLLSLLPGTNTETETEEDTDPDDHPTPTPNHPEPPRTAAPQPPTPPQLDPAAIYGPAGRIVLTLAPHTEAHPAALLLQSLAAFGNLIGPGPHCMVESTRHALNLFVVLVGDSSKGRKGTSWNLIANLFAGVDPVWLTTRVNTARLTASGLVRALRDQQPPTDRRLLALAEEFATVAHSLKRGNGHLSPLLRCAWDNGNLPTLDMHHSLRATGTHLSLIAHITQRELTQSFQRHQAHNGFANRCLWTWIERANCLPNGDTAPAHEIAAIAGTLRRAVAWATARPEILFRRDPQAQELWQDCYESLSYRHPGLRGAATSRGEAQVLRLSALYAALDSSELVCLPHLQAAYAVWTYCYRSAAHLFGLATGDPVADRIREAVEASPNGLSRSQINRLFHGHVPSDHIDAALEQLTAFGALAPCRGQTSGRSATQWLAAGQ